MDGRRLVFTITAYDERIKIGEGNSREVYNNETESSARPIALRE